MPSTQSVTANIPARFTLLFFTVPESPYPTDTVAQAFPQDEYLFLAVSPEKAADALAKHRPDAILAANTPAVAKLFRSIEQKPGATPFRVLLPTPNTPLSEASPADAVLTPDSTSWARQLQPMLRMRAQIMALREENTQLRKKRGQKEKPRKDAELELFKRYIFNNVAHELRTPLLQMKAALANLAQDPGSTMLIDLAVKATARLEDNVQNILQFAQSTNITLDAAFINESVEIALRSLRNSWRHSTQVQRVVVAVDPILPPVLADKRAIGSALKYLIENGLKFSQETVIVKAWQEGESVIVSVQDFGIGIPKEMHDTIFGEFVQGDPTSTRRFDGMGIGLAIVRIIMDHHHTSVEVESEPGHGSRFSFRLKIVPLDPPHS
jgi:signal transduction histidine kinase